MDEEVSGVRCQAAGDPQTHALTPWASVSQIRERRRGAGAKVPGSNEPAPRWGHPDTQENAAT
jgi:hypothetical protein